MTISQTVINERCNRWLADILERRDVPNPHDLAKHITTELLAQGLAPVPRPFPLRATAPAASEEARRAAREAAAEAVAAAKAKRTRVGPPPTPNVEDLVAGAALLGLNQDDVATAIEQLNLPGPTVGGQPACDPIGHVQVVEDEQGVYGILVDTDPTMPVDLAELRSDDGTVLATFDDLDGVVSVVIHEADCPGGDCTCGQPPSCGRCYHRHVEECDELEPHGDDEYRCGCPGWVPEIDVHDDQDDDEPSTWGPDDPPF